MNETGYISKVAGPLVIAKGLKNAKMYDLVKVGPQKLLGEIIEIKEGKVSVQVYEETTGIGANDVIESTGDPLSVELGPGLLGSIFDGTQRPLDLIKEISGDFIERGTEVKALNREKKWDFKPIIKKGEEVHGGDIIGEVKEGSIKHFIMVPFGKKGVIEKISNGQFSVEETIAILKTNQGQKEDLKMISRWPVRTGRPYRKKLRPEEPLVTGQRVIDTFFPLTKGGTATVPGPFGAGKTVIQHMLAKWADSEIIIFIGVGERGNEMTDALLEFAELEDPKTGKKLLERTVFIANTSNMPVAAREACIYTGMAIAEYFRDMGYNVSLQADSTSRWAEALREISARLEELPGEEGYPAYLGSRLAQFYERAGKTKCLCSKDRTGSVSVIGSVSPPGGDLSEPVVQNTLRVVKVFWSLEDTLAFRRHFPAINWLSSYSLYAQALQNFLKENIADDFHVLREEALTILQKEADLLEIVRLVGTEALTTKERVIIEVAKMIREDFLQQNAFDEIDNHTSLKKQYLMIKLLISFYHKAIQLTEEGAVLEKLINTASKPRIATMKLIAEDKLTQITTLQNKIIDEMNEIAEQTRNSQKEVKI